MALKLFKNILLTLCAFFACFYLNQINAYKYKDNWVETIDKYSNAWGQLSEPTSMWLERTKKISKKFASLMAFSGPVSALVAAGLNTAFQPESDEYKAISKLNVDVIKRFNKISLELQSIGNRLFHRMNMIDYKNNVVFPMVTLQQIVNLALEPFPDPDIKKELKTTCWGGNGPVPTLIRIRDKVRNSCDWPDINDEKLIKRALQLFWKMENMKNIKDMHGELLEKYNLLKKEFLQNLRSTYQLKQLEISKNYIYVFNL
ncbi:hypothetical protein Mgra_00007621 [Meloidogyne graminicola]|uniref:Uncharacterized protein n=1 Tax=Meloidogyne graminicola TaxID=189291 RepID=A0A8S9ZI07_9BILA|nr:hypothetical protein Mgra_00007621 [Meloidogyne graminicola]